MAKVIAEFDTVAKTLSVSMDGAAVPDISYVSMGMGYDDKYICDLVTSRKDETNKMVTRTHIMASENPPQGAKAHATAGFVTVEETNNPELDTTPAELSRAISSFLNN